LRPASSSPSPPSSSSSPSAPAYFAYLQITLCAFAGGVLGVLMMVPLRRALIVKEHGALPYPEGTACADVLVAGEQGGNMAKAVFMGLGVGAAWKGLSWIVQLTRTAIGYTMARGSFFPNATLNVDISPEYMGVGYVIGPRIAGVMFAGGVLSWLVLLPLFTMMGENMTAPFPPVPAQRQDAERDEPPARSGGPTSATPAPAPCSPRASSPWPDAADRSSRRSATA
jgi:hypothetical protein